MDIQSFLEIEKKYDLYHIEVNGVQCWQYVRFRFWNYKICSNKLRLASSTAKQSIKEIVCRNVSNIWYILTHPSVRRLHQADICFINHSRRVKNQDIYECIYTDKLVKEYYPDCVVLEKPFQMQHLRPVDTPDLYYTDIISIKGNLYYQFHARSKSKLYKKIKEEVSKHFRAPIEEILATYGVEIKCTQIEKELVRAVLESIVLKKQYRRILESIKPKAIIEVVSYAKQCMIINEIAKEKNILTIELQHGTMHADHAAYQYVEDCGAIAQFPDVIFAFSDYWKRCIHVPIDESQIIAVGYPYFERKLEQYPKVPHDKKTILFISQGTIGTELSKLAAELFRLLDSSEYRIIYKLHPEEYSGWPDRCPWLCQEGIEVVDSLEHNIYEYFAQSDIQVGAYSTAIYEGLGFGLQTYIYQVGHADTMKELCEQGYATLVRDANELVDAVKADVDSKQASAEKFWIRNALQNMKDEIDNLM